MREKTNKDVLNKKWKQRPTIQAMIDISKWLSDKNASKVAQIYIVTPKWLNTLEQRKLNKQLGIHKINMKGGKTKN